MDIDVRQIHSIGVALGAGIDMAGSGTCSFHLSVQRNSGFLVRANALARQVAWHGGRF